jgi:hypothetical protein
MSRILLFVAALVIALPASGQCVVDHYRSMTAQTKDNGAYTLTQTASGWRAKGSEEYARIDVIVDIASGYFRLNDEGTGGGNLVTEVAVFKPATGGPILGNAQRYHYGVQPQAGKTRFYRLAGGRWRELAATDLPPLTPLLFVPTRGNPPAPDYGNLRPVVVHLPRAGTTVDVYLTPSATAEDCPMQNWLNTQDPVKGCKELTTVPTHVELAFDRQRGAFTVTGRDRKAAPKLQ